MEGRHATLNIVNLYPNELGINGDVGNVTALVTRARWRGITVDVHNHQVGAELPDQIDLIHIGSGPLSSQRLVHADVLRLSAALRSAVDSGVPLLAIAGGWQLLGRELTTQVGERMPGAGVFASAAVLSSQRTVGEILLRRGDTVLAGFENHGALTTLEAGSSPLGQVIVGGGNTPHAAREERVEGIRCGAAIGTQLHGPILPMNPSLADELLRAALDRRGDAARWDVAAAQRSDPIRTVDEYAKAARSAIAGRLGSRG
ncbi:type 1 glutamine amidotransferase [Rathayibacter soli]|uniref:type 1 glutamine amidotransferase n=1 Tax=Rathayibacter soli TaxID=3144168 RepID=UPI0027E5A86B|nr:cobyric acid synthase [Glaciibacter superstes]